MKKITVFMLAAMTAVFLPSQARAVDPQITLTTPNGDEQWFTGFAYTIKWTSQGLTSEFQNRVSISIIEDGNIVGTNLFRNTTDDGQEVWQIPADFTPGRYNINIFVCNQDSSVCFSDSSNKPFTILSSLASNVKVIAPNGGEKWEIGSQQTIRWTDSNSANQTYTIHITAQNGNSFGVAGEVFNKTEFVWAVGLVDGSTRLSIGSNYYVQIVKQFTGPSLSTVDQSDGAFSIVSSNPQASAPIISSISPTQGRPGETIKMIIRGQNFTGANDISGSGINPISDRGFKLQTSRQLYDTEVEATFYVEPSAVLGLREITITTPNGGTSQPVVFNIVAQRDWSKECHPTGTLINQDGAIYKIWYQGKIGYSTAPIFRSYGYTFGEVIPASECDRNLPVIKIAGYADGDLLVDKGAVYIIFNDGQKYGFTSKEIFEGLGYSFKNVFPADLSGYQLGGLIDTNLRPHPDGTLINQDGAIYLMRLGKKWHIPSMNIFRSHRFRLDRVVKVNQHDRTLPWTGETLSFAEGTLLNVNGGIYVLDGIGKRPFRNARSFLELSYKFPQALKVQASEIANYPEGEPYE